MKKLMLLTIVAVLAGLLFFSGAAQASGNGFDSIAYKGTGCPQGSVERVVSPDGQALSILFNDFHAETGEAIPVSEAAKYCRIEVTMQTNESVGIAMDALGFVFLQNGSTGIQRQKALPARRSNQVTHFVGPVKKDYLVHSSATVLAQGKPSRTTFTIMLRIKIDTGKSKKNVTNEGKLTIDTVDLVLD